MPPPPFPPSPSPVAASLSPPRTLSPSLSPVELPSTTRSPPKPPPPDPSRLQTPPASLSFSPPLSSLPCRPAPLTVALAPTSPQPPPHPSDHPHHQLFPRLHLRPHRCLPRPPAPPLPHLECLHQPPATLTSLRSLNPSPPPTRSISSFNAGHPNSGRPPTSTRRSHHLLHSPPLPSLRSQQPHLHLQCRRPHLPPLSRPDSRPQGPVPAIATAQPPDASSNTPQPPPSPQNPILSRRARLATSSCTSSGAVNSRARSASSSCTPAVSSAVIN